MGTAHVRQGLRIVNALLGIAIIAIAVGTSSSRAHNFGSISCGPDLAVSVCVARDADHQYYLRSISSDLAASFDYIMGVAYRTPTDINPVRTWTDGSNVDVNVYQGNYGSGYWGVAFCPSSSARGTKGGYTWCDPHTVRYNRGYYPSRFDTYYERQVLACHEMGHTVGLRDRTREQSQPGFSWS